MTPEEFKTAREALGLTQVEFAQVFQVSPRAVGGWEQGERATAPAHGSARRRAPRPIRRQASDDPPRARDQVMSAFAIWQRPLNDLPENVTLDGSAAKSSRFNATCAPSATT